VISDDEKFKKRDVHADRLVLILIKTCREAEDSIKEARAALTRLRNDANDERIEGSKTILDKHKKVIVKSREKMEATMIAYKQIHKAEYYAGKCGNKNVEGGHHLPDRASSPTAALPRLLQFEERLGHWNDTLTRLNNDTNAYLCWRAHTQHLASRSGEPIVGDKRNMAEVVSGGVEKMQRMKSSSYARGSKTAEAAMDSARTVQQETTGKQPEQVQSGGYKGRDSNYDPHYSSSSSRRRCKQDRRENRSDYYERDSSPRTGGRVSRTNAQRRYERKLQEDGEQ
jgi:hypothetical protein